MAAVSANTWPTANRRAARDNRAGERLRKGEVMDIAFAGRPGRNFGFFRYMFGGAEAGPGILELAYALTVHKAQGSEFDVVVIVLPKGRMAYRELIYTALTRSREQLSCSSRATASPTCWTSASQHAPTPSGVIPTSSGLLFGTAITAPTRNTSSTGPPMASC